MKLICAIADHRAGDDQRYNSGYFFGRCGRCGRDLIRTGRQGWRGVPRGHAVVWKDGRHSHSLAADFEGLLPDLHPEENLPAPRPRFSSWSRAMVGRAVRRRAAAIEPAAERNEEYPRLMVLAVIFGTGIQLLRGRQRGTA